MYNEVRELFIKQSAKEGVGRVTGTIFLQFSAMAVALFLAWRIKAGVLTIGDYVALMASVITVQSTLGNIGMNIGKVFETSLYINNLFDFLETPEIKNDTKMLPFPKDNFSKIIVQSLDFSYPNENIKILENINFEVKRGEKIAIVGENGAGKSTLINCLIGLYVPSKGNIYFGNIELSRIVESSLREHISAIFQDFVRYSYTVRENIGFGQLSKMNDDSAIQKAINKVNLDTAIEKLPEGLDTILGREFQGGQELSGGEWQRIAIARAFMRSAEILVFDEPTSALDPTAELEIFKCFQQLAQDKTAFMISHRLGPARLADRILVLKNGKLVEQGNHDELMELKGEYAHMYETQAEWYKESSIQSKSVQNVAY